MARSVAPPPLAFPVNPPRTCRHFRRPFRVPLSIPHHRIPFCHLPAGRSPGSEPSRDRDRTGDSILQPAPTPHFRGGTGYPDLDGSGRLGRGLRRMLRRALGHCPSRALVIAWINQDIGVIARSRRLPLTSSVGKSIQSKLLWLSPIPLFPATRSGRARHSLAEWASGGGLGAIPSVWRVRGPIAYPQLLHAIPQNQTGGWLSHDLGSCRSLWGATAATQGGVPP